MISAILQFDCKPEHRDAFILALSEHGRGVASSEPGILRFDVVVDQDDPNRIFLFEAYADTEAFTAHLAAESHQIFVREVATHDWLTMPLAGPPRPFAPFLVGRGESVFTVEDVRNGGL
jgi:(4S)-4-hydroxy-5-phosphonooxypentane-2,3-dione isomerase